jgi:hypothetical protein
MEDLETSNDFKVKIDQVKINLNAWTRFEWVLFFFIAIPAILVLIYALPREIKNTCFILNPANLWNLQSWLLNGYTHSELYLLLETNVFAYFIALIAVFSLENNKRRFRVMAGSSSPLVPSLLHPSQSGCSISTRSVLTRRDSPRPWLRWLPAQSSVSSSG